MKMPSCNYFCENCHGDIDLLIFDRNGKIYTDLCNGNGFLCPACGFATLIAFPRDGGDRHVSKEHIVPRMLIPEKATPAPPGAAKFLLTMLATTRRAEAEVGDTNEHFTRECREFGHACATRLYWARTLRLLPSLVWHSVGRAVVRTLRRLFGPGAA